VSLDAMFVGMFAFWISGRCVSIRDRSCCYLFH